VCAAVAFGGPQKDAKSIRLALGFYGLVRNLDLSLASVKHFVMTPLREASRGAMDVFVHAMMVEGENNVQLRRTDFLRLSPCAFVAEQQRIVDLQWQLPALAQASLRWRATHLGGGSGPAALQTILNAYRQLYSLSRLARLVLKRHHAAPKRYTHVVAVRSAVIFFSHVRLPPTSLGQRGTIMVPNLQHFGGLNDRFAAGDADTMLHVVMAQFDSLASPPTTNGQLDAHSWRRANFDKRVLRVNSTEDLLCRHLARAHAPVSVSLVPLCMIRVRPNGHRVARDLFALPEAPRVCKDRGLHVEHEQWGSSTPQSAVSVAIMHPPSPRNKGRNMLRNARTHIDACEGERARWIECGRSSGNLSSCRLSRG
jgi:hypothetical protein